MARQAAPHSSASICMTTGTFATPFFRGCTILLSGIYSSSVSRLNRKLMGRTVSVTISTS